MEWKQRGNSKYGLQLRAPATAAAAAAAKKPLKPLPHPVFGGNDEDDVEDQIARQASKKKALKEVEQQHQRALEEDPNVFDYDAVYDEMKEQKTRHLQEDQIKRESKYIHKLVEKAKLRAQEHDIVYERQLAKERSKEDHLYGDKEKFVTGAYKKKLAEQAKWLEEERLRELREAEDEVTNKSDMSDFYRNLLSKNVAFGAQKVSSQSKLTTEGDEGVKACANSSAAFIENGQVGSASGKKESVDRSLESARDSKTFLAQEKFSPSKTMGSGDEEPVLLVDKSLISENSNLGKAARADSQHDLQSMPSAEAVPAISRERVDSEIKPQVIPTTFGETKATDIEKTQTDSILAARERYLARKKMREA